MWSVHTFALSPFIIGSVEVLLKPQPCLERRKFYWNFRSLVSVWDRPSVSACVCLRV